MNASDIEALRRAALKAISEKSGIKRPVLVHSSEDVIPSSGKKIFLFSATEKDKGNSPSVSVVLDESGAEIDFAKLSASEVRSFFKPVARACRLVCCTGIRRPPPTFSINWLPNSKFGCA